MTTTFPVREALRDAAGALQDGRWLIRPPDMAAANVLGEQLWAAFRDVLDAEDPDPGRVRARLAAVPAACEAALHVEGIEDRFAAVLRMLPQALAAVDQEEAVRVLGGFGAVLHTVGNGPEAHF